MTLIRFIIYFCSYNGILLKLYFLIDCFCSIEIYSDWKNSLMNSNNLPIISFEFSIWPITSCANMTGFF